MIYFKPLVYIVLILNAQLLVRKETFTQSRPRRCPHGQSCERIYWLCIGKDQSSDWFRYSAVCVYSSKDNETKLSQAQQICGEKETATYKMTPDTER